MLGQIGGSNGGAAQAAANAAGEVSAAVSAAASISASVSADAGFDASLSGGLSTSLSASASIAAQAALATAPKNQVGTHPPDPLTRFRFRVEIDGLPVVYFQECTQFHLSSTEVHQAAGGPGRTTMLPSARSWKWDPITLKRGIAKDGEKLWEWVMQTVQGKIIPRNVIVSLFDARGKMMMQFQFQKSYPTEWTASGVASTNNEVLIEQIKLAHQGVTVEFMGKTYSNTESPPQPAAQANNPSTPGGKGQAGANQQTPKGGAPQGGSGQPPQKAGGSPAGTNGQGAPGNTPAGGNGAQQHS